jgi:hypothetical protein
MIVREPFPVPQVGAAAASEQLEIREVLQTSKGTNARRAVLEGVRRRRAAREPGEPGRDPERLSATRWAADRKPRGTSGLDALLHRGHLNQ